MGLLVTAKGPTEFSVIFPGETVPLKVTGATRLMELPG